MGIKILQCLTLLNLFGEKCVGIIHWLCGVKWPPFKGTHCGSLGLWWCLLVAGLDFWDHLKGRKPCGRPTIAGRIRYLTWEYLNLEYSAKPAATATGPWIIGRWINQWKWPLHWQTGSWIYHWYPLSTKLEWVLGWCSHWVWLANCPEPVCWRPTVGATLELVFVVGASPFDVRKQRIGWN